MYVLFVRMTNRISGAEKYNYYLARGLVKHSIIKPVFLTDCPEFRNDLEKLGFPAYNFPVHIKEIGTKRDLFIFILHMPQYFVSFIRVIRKLHKVYKFNILCFESMTEKIFLTPLFRLLFYKVIWIEHGPLFITQSTYIIKKMYLWVSRLANGIVAVSQDTKRDLITGGVESIKVSTIYIGIDIQHYQNDLRQTILKRSNIVGFVGTLNEEKGIIRFFRIAKKLLKKNSNIFFIVVGDGPQYGQLSNLIKQQRIEKKFLLTGFVNDTLPYLQKMNIVIFPTKHHEGLSLAILEALAMGKLVFANDKGGNSELILPYETGYLFKYINNKLVDLILRSLKDDGNQNRIRKNAVEHIGKYFNQKKQTLSFVTFITKA